MTKLIWAYYCFCYVAVALCLIMMVREALARDWLAVAMFAIAGVVNERNLVAQHRMMFP